VEFRIEFINYNESCLDINRGKMTGLVGLYCQSREKKEKGGQEEGTKNWSVHNY
jgi:hypothetical protein